MMSVLNQKHLQNLKEGSVTSSKVGARVSRKIHTDKRHSLKQETQISLMTIKFNANNDCYESCFSDEPLTKCKKATRLAVKDSQKAADDDDNIEAVTTAQHLASYYPLYCYYF